MHKQSPLNLIGFIMKNAILIQTNEKKFNEYYLKKLFEKSNRMLVLFIFIFMKKDTFDTIFFSLILLKNVFSHKITAFSCKMITVLQRVSVDFFLCTPVKINNQFKHILSETFRLGSFYTSSEKDFIVESIYIKMEKKLNRRNKVEYFLNILKLTKLIGISSCSHSSKVFGYFLLIFLKIIAGNDNLFLSQKYEVSIEILIQTVLVLSVMLKENFGKNCIFQYILHFFFLNFHQIGDLDEFKIRSLRIQEKIISLIIKIWDYFEEELIIFVPIIFDLYTTISIFKKNRKSIQLLKFLCDINTSIHSSSIIKIKHFYFKYANLLFSLMISSYETNNLGFIHANLFAFEEKITLVYRKTLIDQLISTSSLNIRKKICRELCIMIRDSVRMKEMYRNFSLQTILLFKKTNELCLSGNSITYSNLLYYDSYKDGIIHEFTEEKGVISNFVLDFIRFFRFQISLKVFYKISKNFLKSVTEKHFDHDHFLHNFENLLSAHGNDGKGIIMIDIGYNEKEYIITSFINDYKLQKYFTTSQDIFFKLLMRLYLTMIFIDTFDNTKFVEKTWYFLESVVLNQGEQTILYSLETFFLFMTAKQLENQFLQKTAGFCRKIIVQKIHELTPFVYEIFGHYLFKNQSHETNEIAEYLFMNLLNPVCWKNICWAKSMIKFLSSFLESRIKTLDNLKFYRVLAIFETALLDAVFFENSFDTKIFVYQFFVYSGDLVPHFLEVCFDQIIHPADKKLFWSKFNLASILIQSMTIERYLVETNKLGKNFHFLFLIKFLTMKQTSYSFSDFELIIFVFRLLIKDSLFSTNFQGFVIRKMILCMKNARIIKGSKKDRDNFRFSLSFQDKNYEQQSFLYYCTETIKNLKEYSKNCPDRINVKKMNM